jgi:hypothetical protein
MRRQHTRRIAALAALLALPLGATVALATSASAATATATFTKTSDWGSGFQGQYTIKNTGSATLNGWRVEFDLPAGTSVGTYWDALMTQSGSHYTFTNREYNGSVAPGASTGFGFIGSGSGSPASCKLNGAACSGSSDPGPTPTPTPTPPPPPPPGTLRTAPYVDMGAWPTPSLSEMAQASGLKGFTMAFVVGGACRATWFGAYDPRSGWMKDEVNKIRAAGGDVKISFGGANGIELAQACSTVDSLAAEYKAVVDAYHLTYIDLDIEGAATADPASVNRRSAALKKVQAATPGLRVSLTLPVLPSGLTADGLNVVRSARDAGVALDLVNVMAMDYYQQGGNMGDKAIQAAQSTRDQLASLYPGRSDADLWRMVGVTPMLGVNDSQFEVFRQDDARKLVQFAQQKHLGMLAFWEETRDRNACNGALYKCTNIPQQPYEFSKIFGAYTR